MNRTPLTVRLSVLPPYTSLWVVPLDVMASILHLNLFFYRPSQTLQLLLSCALSVMGTGDS